MKSVKMSRRPVGPLAALLASAVLSNGCLYPHWHHERHEERRERYERRSDNRPEHYERDDDKHEKHEKHDGKHERYR